MAKKILFKVDEFHKKMLVKGFNRQSLADTLKMHRSALDLAVRLTDGKPINGIKPENAQKIIKVLDCQFEDIFIIEG